MRHLLEDGDCGSRSSSQVCSDSPLSRIQWDESVSSCAKPLVQGRVELDLELVNTEAILRVIGYLHSDQNIYLFEERNKREWCDEAGEYVKKRL
jgi:hypothetical protein